ncbi:hypothetical protein, partial [Enterococcus faecalis]|uniref:hypothetical protein n=1 Tax=Enterococcus faecalis TaxID=1351 RepID=UPI004041D26B
MAVLCSEELGEAYVTPFQKFNSNSGDFEYFYTTVSKDYSPIQTCGIVLNKMLAKNGGRNTDAMPDQSFLYDQSQNLSDNLFIRPGYTFKNWDDLAKGGGNSYTDKQNVKNLVSEANGTVTLYAQWT